MGVLSVSPEVETLQSKCGTSNPVAYFTILGVTQLQSDVWKLQEIKSFLEVTIILVVYVLSDLE